MSVNDHFTVEDDRATQTPLRTRSNETAHYIVHIEYVRERNDVEVVPPEILSR